MSVAVLAVLASCGADEPATQQREESADTAPPTVLPQSDEPVELDPAEFTADVTNPWFPLEPGTRWTWGWL